MRCCIFSVFACISLSSLHLFFAVAYRTRRPAGRGSFSYGPSSSPLSSQMPPQRDSDRARTLRRYNPPACRGTSGSYVAPPLSQVCANARAAIQELPISLAEINMFLSLSRQVVSFRQIDLFHFSIAGTSQSFPQIFIAGLMPI